MSIKSRIIGIPIYDDTRGMLCVVEGSDTVPFEIKRVFSIFGCDGESTRGKHANRNSEFVMQCLVGECTLEVIEQDGSCSKYILSSASEAVYMPAMTWKEMYGFSQDAVLIVYSSEHYDPEEYIVDRDLFLKGIQSFI